MYKLVLLVSLLAFFVAPMASASAHCSKTYTVAMAQRADRAVYAGTRHSTRGERGELLKFVRCQRNPRAIPYADWYRRHQAALNLARRQAAQSQNQFTGYVVSGTVSTFGPPAEGGSQTADGGDDSRPCIALRDTSTLGRMFLVTINGHSARLLHCDSGPYAGGRSIDVTGNGAYAMGLNPYNFPTDAWGVARELR